MGSVTPLQFQESMAKTVLALSRAEQTLLLIQAEIMA